MDSMGPMHQWCWPLTVTISNNLANLQALDRSGGKVGNKGGEAAETGENPNESPFGIGGDLAKYSDKMNLILLPNVCALQRSRWQA